MIALILPYIAQINFCAARAVTAHAMSQQVTITRQLSKSIQLANRTISGHRWRHASRRIDNDAQRPSPRDR
jgi:hypothetical protein